MRRLLTRRLVRGFLVLALLNIVIASVWVFNKSSRNLAGAEAARKAVVNQCLQGSTPGGLPSPRARLCTVPLSDPRFHMSDLDQVFEALSPLLIFAMWVLGASFIGAEWEAGTIGALLTREPRRVRVLAAKLAAAVAFALVVTALLLALLAVALLPAALLRGTLDGTGGAWRLHTTGLALRIVAASALGAILGFSVAASAKRTTVAIGALLLAFLMDVITAGLFPGLQRWQIMENLLVFASASARDVARSIPAAGILVAIYAAVLFAASALYFRRRDVT